MNKYLTTISIIIIFITFPCLSNAANKTVKIKSDVSKTGLLSYSGAYTWQTGDFFVGDDINSKKGGKGLLIFNLSAIPKDVTIVKATLWLTSELRLDSNFGGQLRAIHLSNLDDLVPNQTSWQNLNKGAALGNVSIEEGKTLSVTGDSYKNMVKNNIGGKVGISLIHNTIGKIARFWQTNCWLEVVYEEKEDGSGGTSEGVDANFPLLNVQVTNITKNSCKLSWQLPEGIIKGYQIADKNKNILHKNKSLWPALTYSVTDMEGDSCYTFYVRYSRAVYVGSEGPTVYVNKYSRWSKVQVITLPSKVPGMPQNVQAEDINNGCIISWEPPVEKTYAPIEYTIYRKKYDSSSNQWEIVRTYEVGKSLQYAITGLTIGATYNFFVEAKNVVGKGLNSHVSVTIKKIPDAPTELKIHRVGDERILTWKYSSTDIDSFKVFAHAPNFIPFFVDKSQHYASVGRVTYIDVKYFYMVAAYKGRLFSPFGSLEYYEPVPRPYGFTVRLSDDGDFILHWEYSRSDINDFVINLTEPTFLKKQFIVDKNQRELNVGKTFSGLNYTFTIQARLHELSDEASLSFRGGTELDTPSGLRYYTQGNNWILHWNEPLFFLDDYLLEQSSPTKEEYVINKSDVSFNIGKARLGYHYSYTLKARKGGVLSDGVSLSFDGGTAEDLRNFIPPTNFHYQSPSSTVKVLLWDYPDTIDIDDFRVILQSPTNEGKTYVVDKQKRYLVIEGVKPGVKYVFTLQARCGSKYTKVVSLTF